ncbi:unnamed protein product [Linum trigynum]|uniref:Chromatin modification-related protein EAF1 B-like n=1 Tax=Linum trigynum TaxID=586398 RepID=A0AAV2GMN8_9ROSI
MHGCYSRSDFLVNAEVDSMGGVVDGGVGIGIKTSPRRAAIEKAQAELRQEYDVREERRRELEFLEKGGNPLDFKFGNAASISVQSTSLTYHQAEHVVTSKAKGSFPLTASPHGDSVESSGQPGPTTVCEPNSADNFDGQNDLLGGDRNRRHLIKRNGVALSEQSLPIEGAQNAKESEDSAIVRPYARRNRSRPNRDGTRSSSGDVIQSSGVHGSSFPRGSRNIKLISESNNQKDNAVPSACKPKPTTSNGEMIPQMVEVQPLQATEAPKSSPVDKLDARESNTVKDKEKDQPVGIDTRKQPADDTVRICDENVRNEQVVSVGLESSPCVAVERSEVEAGSALLNDFRDQKANENVGQNVGATKVTKGLDSDSSCTPSSLSLDVNNGSSLCINHREEDSNKVYLKQATEIKGTQNSAAAETCKDRDDSAAVGNNASGDAGINCTSKGASANGVAAKIEDIEKSSGPQNGDKCTQNLEEIHQNEITEPVSIENAVTSLDNELISNRVNAGSYVMENPSDLSLQQEQLKSQLPENSSASAAELHSYPDIKINRAREDSILEEARSIEAKRKRIAELSLGVAQVEARKMSHWEFVLEEMAWLANDFAQERLWKMTAAAQICRRVTLTSRLRVEQQNQCLKLQKVSYTLAKAVMQFWQSAEMLLCSDKSHGPITDIDEDKPAAVKVACKEFEQQSPRKNDIKGYAVRFLKFNSSPVPAIQAEQPTTPDLVSDAGVMEVSWDDHLTEESLFYAVPSGAMDSYRSSIESHLVQFEKTGSSMQEEGDTSMLDAGPDFGHPENGYDEDEGETSTYYLHGAFESSRPRKHDQKKRTHSLKSFPTRSYEVGTDVPYGTVGPQNTLMGKRPASNLGPILPKRMRTASRQRVISPFSNGVPTGPSAPAKTDASSGDTSSFQDDQSTLHGGSQIQKGMEVDSISDFEKHLSYDCSDIMTKPKKKKKSRHLGSAYEQRWQHDSTALVEQREHQKKRLENHHFVSNGKSGLYGQHTWKKPKMLKQSLDAYDNVAPSTGSIPSPAASQMSNMPSTNRFMRLINGRDKGRKPKSLKISVGQPGFGSPWSLFEDQALVVLVHDMGPNWELVSDAINSTLHFKCIFRAPKECKERHKVLMDKGAGDGADSAEDSGTSQSYPSTLPGIPKGSARQLFQRLQGPMEEDTLKSHFEKIIMIGKKLHYGRSQNDTQDPKQIPVHNSHVIALSQVCPNNLNGSILTPIELCDMDPSSQDILGYQGSHASGLPMPSQGVVGSTLPASAVNPSVQGSSGMALSNNTSSPSPSGSLPASSRDGRFSAPRTSLRAHEHPRTQHFNQMLPGRSLQQSNLSVSGPLPGGNGMGMMPGLNRNMPLSRPGFQGTPPPVSNSSSMLSSSVSGIPGGVNMQSGTGSGQSNSLTRPREPLHMMRKYSSGHPQPQHLMSPQQPHVLGNPHLPGPNQATASPQQAYAIRLAKERQMHQRFLQQQQQQQFTTSSTLMPHVQPQPQLPVTLPMQNTPQIPPQTLPQPVPLTQSSPMSVQQQKVNLTTHHGPNRNPQGITSNQMGKQRQRPQQQQQFQQPGRGHPQQRQQHQSQSSQQKHAKGIGRGNMIVHQNQPVDHSHKNGISIAMGNKGAEKGDQIMQHLMQVGQGLYSGSGLAPPQPSSKPGVSPQSLNHPQPQQKQFPGSSQHSSKQLQQMPSSHSDSSCQGQVPSLSAGHAQTGSHQGAMSAVSCLNKQQHQKHQANQAQSTVQRTVQQKCKKNSGSPTKPLPDKHDQQSPDTVAQMGTSATTAPVVSNDSANVVSVGTSGVQAPWIVSEPTLYDSVKTTPASQVDPIGSMSLQNTAAGEPVTSASQGLGQRQLSGGFSQQGQNHAAKWQQQPQPQVQQSTATPSQQIIQPQEQPVLQEEQRSPQLQKPPLQQTHVQTGQDSLYSRPSNAKLE